MEKLFYLLLRVSDPVTKKSKAKSVLKVGYLEDLYDDYDDPIEHFTKLAKEMTDEDKLKNVPLVFSFDKDDVIDDFWNNRQRTAGVEFNLNHIFQALTFLRILNPSSKKASFESLNVMMFTELLISLMLILRI